MTIDLLCLFIGVIVLLLIIWAARRLMAAFSVPDPFNTVIYVFIVVLGVLAILSCLGYSPLRYIKIG